MKSQAQDVFLHDGSEASVRELSQGRLRLTLFVDPQAPVESVMVHVDQAGNDPWFRLRRIRGGRMTRYQVTLTRPVGAVTYRFRIQTKTRRFYFDRAGIHPTQPGIGTSFRLSPPGSRPPSWAQDQVFYQIFPDRFRRGAKGPFEPGPERGQGEEALVRAWGDRPKRSQGGREFYGGDLIGVADGLAYLQELGVSSLYLNPIFEAGSNHRYDAKDFRKVDRLLGGMPAYRRLRRETRVRGMRLILDGVFNHCSNEFEGFDPELAGARGHWFTKGPKGGYISWWGVPTLPKFDLSQPEVQRYLFRGKNSIVQRWLRGEHGADGWRLDVANCLGEGAGEKKNLEFHDAILKAALAANPEAYVFGEHFEGGGFWLESGVHHAVMNYAGFTTPVEAFLSGKDHEGHPCEIHGPELWEAFEAHWAGRSQEQILASFNLLGSHDIPRIRTRLGSSERSLVAHVFLFAFPGVPSVYYGDEIGLEGGRDPDCRRTFVWDRSQWDLRLFEGIQRLARARREDLALRRGGALPLILEKDLVVFLRHAGESLALGVIHRGLKSRRLRVDLSGFGLHSEKFQGVLDPRVLSLEDGVLRTTLGPLSGEIFRIL